MTVKRTLVNTGNPLITPDGAVYANKPVTFQLVKADTQLPITLFDAVNGDLVVGGIITATTNAQGEFSQDLWPNTRGGEATYYLVNTPEIPAKPFLIRVTEAEGDMLLIDAKAGVLPVPPAQTLTLFEALLASISALVAQATELATTTVNGLMSSVDKVRLDTLWTDVQGAWSGVAALVSDVTVVRTSTGLAAAVAAAGSTKRTIKFTVDQNLSANIAIPATVELVPLNGARIIHGSYTVSYLGSTASWGNAQVLSGTGAVTLAPDAIVLPAWFGAVNGAEASTAVQKAIATGNSVTIPDGIGYTVKNLMLTTAGQAVIVNGTLTLPAACSDNDTIFEANGVDGIKIAGRGKLDGNKALQSGAVSQQLVRLIGCDDVTVEGLTCMGNYSGAVSSYAAIYLEGLRDQVRDICLHDWSKEGVYLNNCSYSSVTNIIAVDADGDSWSAVQVGGATSAHNQIEHVIAKNTGASAVGLDSTYSTMSNITAEGVRFQNGVNMGHTGKPASYSTASDITIKGLTDNVNVNSAGLNIGGGTVHVTVDNLIVDGSTQRGVNIGDSASNVDISNVKLKDCLTGFAMYKAGRVSIKNLTVSGTVGTGISKDNGATADYTTMILDTCDLTAATNKITGAAGGLDSPYTAYQSATFNSADATEGSVSVAALGAGGTVTVTNANARANNRIILEPSNVAGAGAIPFISTQNDGSFVVTTVNNGAAGAFVRWKIV